MSMVFCSQCRSTKVQMTGWIDMETGLCVELLGDAPGETFCSDCEAADRNMHPELEFGPGPEGTAGHPPRVRDLSLLSGMQVTHVEACAGGHYVTVSGKSGATFRLEVSGAQADRHTMDCDMDDDCMGCWDAPEVPASEK